MKTQRKNKGKKSVGDYRGRVKKRLRAFYLVHIALLAVYLLVCGVFFARSGSEALWHGESAPVIVFSDVKAWINEKWDLFLDEIGDRIKQKSEFQEEKTHVADRTAALFRADGTGK